MNLVQLRHAVKIWNEPPHDKNNKMTVCPAKTRISLGIHPVWWESSLCTQWVAKDPGFLHADSEDWSDWVDAQAHLRLRWAHHFVGFVMRRLKYSDALKNCWTYPKIWSTSFFSFHRVMCPKDADGKANSIDPDPTAVGVVWSGSALLAQTYLSEN